ncbi:MAG: hypothetical protein NTW86_21820 [Candidatus Sumerlaeota bacterium]|nr:hypothetical protein [Candidatus Sumerlaeota bacterium]
MRRSLSLVLALAGIVANAFCGQPEQGVGDAICVVFRGQEAVNQTPRYAVVQTALRTLAPPEGRGHLLLLSMTHVAGEQFYKGLEPELDRADIILYESMKDAPGNETNTPREVDLLTSQLQGMVARLTGLHLQRSWELRLMEGDSRWRCIDLPASQFYAYLDEHPVDLRPAALRHEIADLEALERTDPSEAARFLRSQMLRGFMDTTAGNCCYTWLAPEPRRIVHQFIHVQRDANFLSQVSQAARDNPDRTIAVMLGAQHIPPLERSLETEFHFEETSACWFDAITIQLDQTGSVGKPEASSAK